MVAPGPWSWCLGQTHFHKEKNTEELLYFSLCDGIRSHVYFLLPSPSPLLTTQSSSRRQRLLFPLQRPVGCCLPSSLVSPILSLMDAHTLPSSHLKSGKATSCRGICRRKSGFWQRGFPVTIFLFRSQSPSQASWQLQLNGLARRFLEEVGNVVRRALCQSQ